MPLIVRPRAVWITAAPRPIVAIVPLSWYTKGFGLLARHAPRHVLSGALAGLEGDRAELREDLARLRVGDPSDVADGKDLRVPGNREIRPDRDPVPLLQLEPERGDDRVGLEAGAPDQRVGFEDGARFERDPSRLHGRHELADHDLDAELLESLLGVVAEVLLEHREELGRRLDEDDPGLLLRQARVVLGEALPIELGQRAGALDPRRAAADDDDVERSVVHQRRVSVRRPPRAQDVLLEAHGVGQRVHRERVLRGALGSEEGDLGADREHEVVVLERSHLSELHPAAPRSIPVTVACLTATLGCSWKRSRSACPTTAVSSRAVANW